MSQSLIASFGLTGLSPFTSSVSITYDNATGMQRLALTGAQTYAVDLAMMPAAGCKALRLRYETTDALGADVTASITVMFTSSAVAKSMSFGPGAEIQIADPNVVAGITALSVTTTGNALVYVSAVG